MASVSTYLNFKRNTEEAFEFYKTVFGGEYYGQGPMRFADAPPQEGMPPLAEADKNLIMHVELRILDSHSLMGTDCPDSMGFQLNVGNNININLMPDTREETKKLFDRLSDGGTITMPLEDMFWGDYFGSCTDKFGINWMFNCPEKK
ncbi:VOC family protein [Dyadobacter tibetensis]|uniref:VOC family protein n=1 Tax=Dyadobacter tibetensis TaxID=1211851 RepID=UPI000470B0CB|nr:VOC family protein [Dyadobacter tibetensis]